MLFFGEIVFKGQYVNRYAFIQKFNNFFVRRIGNVTRKNKERIDTIINSDLYSFGNYFIKVHEGNNDNLIVVFSGVGNVESSEVSFEWGGSLINNAKSSHVIFVKDNLRHWYTNTDGLQSLVDFLMTYSTKHNINKKIAFGLSMGGYGALVFSSLLYFDKVIALSSRSCIGRYAGFDGRNKELMNAIKESHFAILKKCIFNRMSKYIFISSLDQVNDLKHLCLLQNVCPEGFFYISRGDHNIGHEMNIRGSMSNFLKWILSDIDTKQPAGIEKADDFVFDLGNFLIEKNTNSLSSDLMFKKFPDIRPNQLPLFLLDTYVQNLIQPHEFPDAYPCPFFTSISNNFLKKYLYFGWYGIEKNGALSQGVWHQVKGSLIQPHFDVKQYVIRLHIEILIPGNFEDTKIVLYQKGGDTQEYKVTNADKFIICNFPIKIFNDDLLFDIWIYTPFSYTPSFVSSVSDNRELAIRLKSFIILN